MEVTCKFSENSIIKGKTAREDVISLCIIFLMKLFLILHKL